MRWPKVIKAKSAIDAFALSIDLAPTLLEVGGAPSAKDMHGRSLVPLLRSEEVPWRDSVLIEHFSDGVFPRMSRMGYQCVRTEQWKYIHYVDLDGMDELYDLRADSCETKNMIGQPDARPALEEMKAELDRRLRETK